MSDLPKAMHGMSTGQPWQHAGRSLLYFTATISSTRFPASPGHLAPNTMNPWHKESLHTPQLSHNSSSINKGPQKDWQCKRYNTSCHFQHIFSSNQKEKETSLYLCADLGLEPPTLFSGRCLTTGKITLLELDNV